MSNGGFSYTDEAREYMFSPAGEDTLLDTIEIRHPAFIQDDQLIAIRFVNGAACDIMATLEAGAPMNAGEAVKFVNTRFDLVVPDSPQQGLAQCDIAVANVMAELTPWLALAVSQPYPVQLSLRQFLADDLTEPCFVMHGLTFSNATANIKRVTGTATMEDLLNFSAPRECYTVTNSPGLNR
jgi:hypothetical protein